MSISRNISEFVSHMVGTAVALVIMMTIVIFVRQVGWTAPIESVGLIDQLFHHTPDNAKFASVNVEYRDRGGALIALGPLLSADIRNGRGTPVGLQDGVFVGCDPNLISAGTTVSISIQHGLVVETATVRLDAAAHVLFVSSSKTKEELIALINK